MEREVWSVRKWGISNRIDEAQLRIRANREIEAKNINNQYTEEKGTTKTLSKEQIVNFQPKSPISHTAAHTEVIPALQHLPYGVSISRQHSSNAFPSTPTRC
jgi:hypothetical protein